jgi:hypothetical protein
MDSLSLGVGMRMHLAVDCDVHILAENMRREERRAERVLSEKGGNGIRRRY